MAELFSDYEINRAARWPRLSRLAAGSLVLHALILGAIVYVPAVRSALSLTSIFAGADYVDEDYELLAIGERAEMVSTGDKFQYPPGYFAKQQAQIVEAVAAPTVKPATENRPRFKPTARPTPLPTTQPTPEAIAAATAAPTTQPTATPAVTDDANAALNKAAEAGGVERPKTINPKPFVDLLRRAKLEKDSGRLDLSGSIDVELSADLNDDGTLRNAQVIKLRGDPQLKKLAKEFIGALSASRGLAFLKGAEHLNLRLHLDQKEVAAVVTTQIESAARAKEMADGYSVLLLAARFTRGGDEGVIWRNVSVPPPQGKQVTVNFKLPRATAGEMLSKKLPPG